MSVRRYAWVVGGLLAVGLIILWLGWRPRSRWELVRHVVAKLPFGSANQAVAQSVGMDGHHYGPLAFFVTPKGLAIADTYKRRLIWRWSTGPWHDRTLPGAMIDDVAWSPAKNAWLVVDNRGLTIQAVTNQKTLTFVRVPEQAGFTEAIWHIAVSPSGTVLVEWVRFGQGKFTLTVSLYSAHGRFLRNVAQSVDQRDGELHPQSGRGLIPVLVRNVQLGPQGQVVVEGSSSSATRRNIFFYRDATLERRVTITSPIPMDHTDLLGVSRKGEIFLGVNLGKARRAGLVLVANQEGQLVRTITIPPTPVSSMVYGQVSGGGTLYMVESTAHFYAIKSFSWVERREGKWRL